MAFNNIRRPDGSVVPFTADHFKDMSSEEPSGFRDDSLSVTENLRWAAAPLDRQLRAAGHPVQPSRSNEYRDLTDY
jgi:hypothetical protein